VTGMGVVGLGVAGPLAGKITTTLFAALCRRSSLRCRLLSLLRLSHRLFPLLLLLL
jgi:hypothetical protein